MNIGDFPRLGQVSPRMLRHYDDVGLLSPETVNRVNGYRRYGYRQLDRLHRLVAPRDLGFGLDQISDLLDDNVSVEQIQGMLHLRRAQIAQTVDDEQARLRRVEAHLHALGYEHADPDGTASTPNAAVETLAVRSTSSSTLDSTSVTPSWPIHRRHGRRTPRRRGRNLRLAGALG